MPFRETGQGERGEDDGAGQKDDGVGDVEAERASQKPDHTHPGDLHDEREAAHQRQRPRVPAVAVKRVVEPAAGGKPVAVGSRLERPRDDPAQPAREEERERARRCDAEGGLGRDHAGSARRSTADRDSGHGQDDERHEPHQAVDQDRGDGLGGVVGAAAELHGAHGVAADAPRAGTGRRTGRRSTSA